METYLGTDGLAAVAWGSVNLLLVAAGWRVSHSFGGDNSPTARVMHTTLFCWATVVAAATLLGLLNFLTGPALLALTACWSLACLWLCPRQEYPVSPPTRSDWGYLAGWGALMSFLLGLIVFRLGEFPTDWDSLMYHIPLIDQWLQARSLYAPRDATWYNPGNNELMGLWMVAPFSGDFLIGLNNLPAILLLTLGGLELSRELGLRPPWPLLVSVAVTATVVAFRQTLDAENDLAGGALFLTSVCYSLRYARSAHSPDMVWAAAAAGLLAGVKYYALGYGAVASATLVVAALRAHGIRPALKATLVGLLAALVWGGYWYIRNTILTGTPLYPKGYDEETDVLANWRTGIWSTTLLGSGRPIVLPMALDAIWRMAGPVQATAFLLLPLCVGWLMLPRGGDSGESSPHLGKSRLAFAFALLGSGLIWGITPFAIETYPPGSLNVLSGGYGCVRFGTCFLSAAVVALAVVLHDVGLLLRGTGEVGAAGTGWGAWVRRGLGWVPLLTFAGATGYQLYEQATSDQLARIGLPGLLIGVNLLVLVGNLVLFSYWSPVARRVVLAVIPLCLLAGVYFGTGWLAPQWHAGYAAFYDRFLRTDTVSLLAQREPGAARVAVLNYRYYPYLGSRRQFRVARPLWHGSKEDLLAYLAEHDLNTVVCVDADPFQNGRYRFHKEWIESEPDVFPLLRDGTTLFACEVNPEELGERLRRDPQAGAAGEEPRR